MEIMRLSVYVTIRWTLYKEETEMTDFLQIISSSLLLLPVEYPGGEVIPYLSFIGMCGPRVSFLSGFGQKRDIHLDYFALKYL